MKNFYKITALILCLTFVFGLAFSVTKNLTSKAISESAQEFSSEKNSSDSEVESENFLALNTDETLRLKPLQDVALFADVAALPLFTSPAPFSPPKI